MKENAKKLAVIVMTAAIAMFIAVSTAAAGPGGSHLLRGTYHFTGSGNCVISAGGTNLFTPNLSDSC
jgi:type 1 fimbria pilin